MRNAAFDELHAALDKLAAVESYRRAPRGYAVLEFLRGAGPATLPVILCLRCGAISANKNDLRHKYCGRCHIFHEEG